ncbi:MarR family winged helix-turn-helix transcriptional regulator [Thiosulfativibrio zosterae]|uniref:Transcriptional regulator n=1 Tax=Thiosulfativibrio zosterae TaxID=2675053 RepID=A0A6F8PPG2_9GAMM|nr:MarR family transcriptional regulator [Thiosulfativibrio zosterae]BBP44012.1 transcriptional regulator [Thiosulfativibrio zosterae]
MTNNDESPKLLEPKDDADGAMQKLLLNLFLSQKIILQQSEQIVHRHRFTTLEFDVLATLHRMRQNEQQQMKPSDIVKNLCVSSGGITKVLKSLEIAQLISRQADANDKRIIWVTLTALGESTCLAIFEELHQLHNTKIAPVLSEDEIALLGNALEKLARQLNPI